MLENAFASGRMTHLFGVFYRRYFLEDDRTNKAVIVLLAIC